MRSRYHSIEKIRDEASVGRSNPARTQAVRLSFLSRELLLLGLLLIAGVVIAGLWGEFDSNTQSVKQGLHGHEKLIESVMYSADGRVLISCGWDSTVRLWNLDETKGAWGAELAELPHSSHVYAVAMTPDHRYLASGSVDGFAVWEQGSDGGWRNVLENTGGAHRCVAAAPDGRTLAVGGADGTIRFCDLPSLERKLTLPGFSDEVRALAYSRDGSLLVGLAFDNKLRAWSLRPGEEPKPLDVNVGPATAFAINPAGTMLATAFGEAQASRISLWDLATGREVARKVGSELGNNVMSFTPNGRLLACADKDHKIRLRDPNSGELLRTLDDDLGWVKTVDFSPDSRRMAFGGRDGTVRFRLLPEDLVGRPASQDAGTNQEENSQELSARIENRGD